MNTGCQPPYVNGTGGFCGCNCKCCPPKCCPSISIYFTCGTGCDELPPPAPCPDATCPAPCPPASPLAHWLASPNTFKLPKFTYDAIVSEDGSFAFSSECSVPCQCVCVQIQCGGITPCCCLQLVGCKIYAVGNGYVTAPGFVTIPDCGQGSVFINGSPPPVFVNDGQQITVTVISDDQECCCCNQVAINCSPCALGARQLLFKRKVDPRTGKTKINPHTGKPLTVIDKKELLKRILRAKRLKRRS